MKNRLPGENVSFKTRKDEHDLIMRWINMQDNLTDSLRSLIEREILTNGLRNLQECIPASRNFNPSNNKTILKPSISLIQSITLDNDDVSDLINNGKKKQPIKIFSETKSKKEEKPVNEEISDKDIDSWA